MAASSPLPPGGFVGFRIDPDRGRQMRVAITGSSGLIGTALTRYLADQGWEAAADRARTKHTRLAVLRTGIVLSANGGAPAKQLPFVQVRARRKMGDGGQWQSWISIDDVVSAIAHLLAWQASGPVNLTGPAPVTNAEFTETLGEVLGRPAWLPIPTFGPKLVLGGELAENLLFTGQKVLPTVLQRSGYDFIHSYLESALRTGLAERI